MSSYRFCRTDDIALLVDALNRCWLPYFPDETPMTAPAFKRSIRDLQVWCSSCMVAFAGPDPTGARRALLEASWGSLRDGILRDLVQPHPDLAQEVRQLDVMRYGHAMVRPEVGFVCSATLAAAGAALAGPVHLAHADLSGFSLFEEAFEWGSRAAARVLARRA